MRDGLNARPHLYIHIATAQDAFPAALDYSSREIAAVFTPYGYKNQAIIIPLSAPARYSSTIVFYI